MPPTAARAPEPPSPISTGKTMVNAAPRSPPQPPPPPPPPPAMDDVDWGSPWADDDNTNSESHNHISDSNDDDHHHNNISIIGGSSTSTSKIPVVDPPTAVHTHDHDQQQNHDPWAAFETSASPWAAAAFPDWSVKDEVPEVPTWSSKGLAPGDGYQQWGGAASSGWGGASSMSDDGDVSVVAAETPKLEQKEKELGMPIAIPLDMGDAGVGGETWHDAVELRDEPTNVVPEPPAIVEPKVEVPEPKLPTVAATEQELPTIAVLGIPLSSPSPSPPPPPPLSEELHAPITDTKPVTDSVSDAETTTIPTIKLPEEARPATPSKDVAIPAPVPPEETEKAQSDAGSEDGDDDDFGDFGDFAEEADFDDFAPVRTPTPKPPPPPPPPSEIVPAFKIDTSLVQKLYPIPASIPEPPPLESEIINTTGARKAWYRLTQAGTLRKNYVADGDYVCVKWSGSKVQEEVHKTVAKWLTESRTVGPGKGSRNQEAMFGWGASAPKAHKKRQSLGPPRNIPALQIHSRHSSDAGPRTPTAQLSSPGKPSINRSTVPSPLTATFGWETASSKTSLGGQPSPIGKLVFGGAQASSPMAKSSSNQASPMAKTFSNQASPMGKMSFDAAALTPTPSAPSSRRASLAPVASIQNSPTTSSFAPAATAPPPSAAPPTSSFTPTAPSFAPTTPSFPPPTTPSFPPTTPSLATVPTTPSLAPATAPTTPSSPPAPASFPSTTPSPAPTIPSFPPPNPSFTPSIPPSPTTAAPPAISNGSQTPKPATPSIGPLATTTVSSLDDWERFDGFASAGMHKTADWGTSMTNPIPEVPAKEVPKSAGLATQEDWGKFDMSMSTPANVGKTDDSLVDNTPMRLGTETTATAEADGWGEFDAAVIKPASSSAAQDDWGAFEDLVTTAPKPAEKPAGKPAEKPADDLWAAFGTYKPTPLPEQPAIASTRTSKSNTDDWATFGMSYTPTTSTSPASSRNSPVQPAAKPAPVSPVLARTQIPPRFGSPVSLGQAPPRFGSPVQAPPRFGSPVSMPPAVNSSPASPIRARVQPPPRFGSPVQLFPLTATRTAPASPLPRKQTPARFGSPILPPPPASRTASPKPLPIIQPTPASPVVTPRPPQPTLPLRPLQPTPTVSQSSPTKPTPLTLSTTTADITTDDDDDEWGEMQSPTNAAEISRAHTPIPMPMGLITPAQPTFPPLAPALGGIPNSMFSSPPQSRPESRGGKPPGVGFPFVANGGYSATASSSLNDLFSVPAPQPAKNNSFGFAGSNVTSAPAQKQNAGGNDAFGLFGDMMTPSKPQPAAAQKPTASGNDAFGLFGDVMAPSKPSPAPVNNNSFSFPNTPAPFSTTSTTSNINTTNSFTFPTPTPPSPPPSKPATAAADPWDLSFFDSPAPAKPAPAPAAKPTPPTARRRAESDLWDVPVPASPRKGRKELEEDEIVNRIVNGLPNLSYMLV